MTKSRNINRPKWRPTEADIERVRTEFADTLTADLAQALGVDYQQVVRLARRLGIKKSPEFLNGPAGGRLDGVKGMGTRFPKGHVPPNKGKKGMPCPNPETCFQKGQKPTNWAPIGSLRIAKMATADGYLQIKLTDTGYPPRDWVMYHRHVWEQANGPIPVGHIVVFKGERTTDPERITADRLECITKQEHMRRRTFHQYGPEIAQLVQLRSCITRQINKRTQEAQS